MARPGAQGDRLRQAAERGDTAALLAELAKGGAVDVDQPGPKTGLTALHRAAERGRAGAVRALLKAGATADQPTKRTGQGALHLAAGRGRMEIVRALLDAGADPLMTDSKGWQPLHAATARNHTLVAQLIARRGGNPHQLSAGGTAPGSLLRQWHYNPAGAEKIDAASADRRRRMQSQADGEAKAQAAAEARALAEQVLEQRDAVATALLPGAEGAEGAEGGEGVDRLVALAGSSSNPDGGGSPAAGGGDGMAGAGGDLLAGILSPSALQKQVLAAEQEAAARQRRAEAARVEQLLMRSNEPVGFSAAFGGGGAGAGTEEEVGAAGGGGGGGWQLGLPLEDGGDGVTALLGTNVPLADTSSSAAATDLAPLGGTDLTASEEYKATSSKAELEQMRAALYASLEQRPQDLVSASASPGAGADAGADVAPLSAATSAVEAIPTESKAAAIEALRQFGK
eukprot:SAG22_NODE_137_length_18056_cov_9.974940_6_plen_456_part_00